MKRNIIIALILVGTVLLSACNALEQPEVSQPKGSSKTAAANSFIPEEASEYEKFIEEVSKITDIAIKKKYELSLDKFKFSYSMNYHYAEVKSEINKEIAKKQSAPVKTFKKASGKESSLTYVKTNAECYSQVDYYIDERNPLYYYLYNNSTGKYMGQIRVKFDGLSDTTTMTDEEEFKSTAMDFLKENVDLSDYEFYEDTFFSNQNKIETYKIAYTKKFHGIPSAEQVECFVWSDGVIDYRVYNEGMFDNIDVPEIDLKDVLPLAVEKAECVLENIPEECELAGFSMKDHMFYVDSSGQLMLSFTFQYNLYTPHPEYPRTYTEGIPMAIVID